jgi:hypothetical protein
MAFSSQVSGRLLNLVLLFRRLATDSSKILLAALVPLFEHLKYLDLQ